MSISDVRKWGARISAVLVIVTMLSTFYMGGGGITFDFRSLSSHPSKLARQLLHKSSPFSLSASLSQHRHVYGKVLSTLVAVLLISVFVIVGFEINGTGSAWDSVHLITLGLIYLIASLVSLFVVTNSRSVSGRPHLISTIVLFLAIPILLVYIAMKTDGVISILLFIIAVFMFLCMCMLVYSASVTHVALSKSMKGPPENVNELTWAHIKNGVTIVVVEVTIFTLIALSLSVLGFVDFTEKKE